jgi:diguanylate cyclase (GGDEF)-like protein
MAYRDPMTKAANRRLLQELTEKAMAASRRNGTSVSAIFLDLVRFKRINDSLGHAAGDQVLQLLAARFTESVRDGDIVARVGGDEFVICMPGMASAQDAQAAAGRLRDILLQPFHVCGQTLRVNARFGVAMYPEHADTFDELLSHADPAGGGGGKPDGAEIVMYDSSSAIAPNQLLLEGDLERAIDQGKVFLAFQPVFDLARGTVAGAEALARLDDPRMGVARMGVVRAADFIALAEASGLVLRLERQVLDLALAQAGIWQRAPFPVWVSVNISPASLATPRFVAQLGERIRAAQLDEGRIVLEITERAAMRSRQSVAAVLLELKKLGVRIALDDFGTGLSSLAYLRDLAVDYLKIDRAFASRLGTDAKFERLVEGIIGLGRGVNTTLIAEGVETREQFEWLKGRECELVQGYYTGPPMPAHELTELLAAGDQALVAFEASEAPFERRRAGGL